MLLHINANVWPTFLYICQFIPSASFIIIISRWERHQSKDSWRHIYRWLKYDAPAKSTCYPRFMKNLLGVAFRWIVFYQRLSRKSAVLGLVLHWIVFSLRLCCKRVVLVSLLCLTATRWILSSGSSVLYCQKGKVITAKLKDWLAIWLKCLVFLLSCCAYPV